MGKKIEDLSVQFKDCREDIATLKDTKISLKILDVLTKAENVIAEQASLIAEHTQQYNELVETNNDLFKRISANQNNKKPDEKVDFTDIDDIINTMSGEENE